MNQARRIRMSAIGALLFLVALFAAACSGASITPHAPNPGPSGGHSTKIRHGAFFVPVLPPFSPDSPYAGVSANAKALSGTAAQSDHWFYLVNGYQLQTPVPGVPGSAPVPQTTPYVLAVNGPLPQGAPGPNGGVTAGTIPLASPQTNMLWKLVQVSPGSTSKNQHLYLRSAQSFLPLQPWVGQTPIPTGGSVPSGTYPSLLTGFAAQAVNLDLGAASALSPGVYMNQNTFPFTSGQTSFQQWYYDVATATVNNANGGVLAQTCTPGATGGCVGLASGGTGPASRWYAYPNYLLSAVVAEPTSGPAFPQPTVTTVPGVGVTDIAGEQAAYYYISMNALSATSIQALPNCIIPGQPGYGAYNTTYGIRCDYINVNDVGFISNCTNVANASSPPSGPQPNNPTNPSQTATISAADWAVVGKQMHVECNYAQGVSNTFNSYQTVLSAVFTGASGTIEPIAKQIQSTQPVKVSPLLILRGIVYAVLSAGGTAAGLFANLAQTTIDYNAAHKTPLTTPISATAQSLYGQLDTMFTNDVKNEGKQLQIIVWSWQKLQQIGPLTYQDGPNGLGITFADQADMENEGIAAYQTVLLQTFFPSAYQLSMNPGQKSKNPFKSPGYDTYAYSTFGASTGLYNVNVLCQANGKYKNCPTQQLMASPTPLPEQAQFALFNGLNGWSQLQRSSNSLDCHNVMMNVFNGTPNVLTVRVVPNKNSGSVIAPGAGWSKNPYNAQLFPYGYVPIYAAYSVQFGGNSVLSITVNVSSGSTTVGSFTVRDGYCGAQYYRNISASNVSTASGWSFYPSPQGTSYNYPYSNLWAGTPYGGNFPGYMWVVIQ